MSGIEAGGYDADLDLQLESLARRIEIFAPDGYWLATFLRMARLRLAACLSPGWWCTACGLFMGDCKEKLQTCRGCGGSRA
jgi:hypothetical protein